MTSQSVPIELLNFLRLPRFRYANNFDQLRARVTLLFSALLATAALITFVAILSLGYRAASASGVLTSLLVIFFVQLIVISLVHAGQLRAATLTSSAFLLVLAVTVLFLSGVGASSLLLLVIPLLYNSLVWSWSAVLWLTGLEIVLVALVGSLQSSQALPVVEFVRVAPEDVSAQTLIVQSILGGIGALCAMYAYELRRSLQTANRLLAQLRASAEIAQLTITAGGPAELMPRIADYIRDRFGFYHVQIFLADADRRYANLVASTGEAGELMLRRGYRVAFASQGAVGRALQSGEPIVVDTREESNERRGNELLPDARSEIALPLVADDQVLGALDIQSVRSNAFPREQIESLSILAAQVSAAVFNAQQIQNYRTMLSDTHRTLLETEVNLAEARRLNQRLTGQAWEDYLKSRSVQTIGYTLNESRLQRDIRWTPALEQAAMYRRPVLMTTAANHQLVAVPIELRGRSIGAIEIELSSAVRQTETLEILQALAQRLALSIDNARLFEQAQELAQRELEVNAISANLQAISDIDGLARAALQELSRALGAVQASIRIGSTESDALSVAPSGKSA
ncbi:MAG: GAF domain-containing protein [Anaerolineae bacterium]|nr:GAF domain-containing protein [Anaerolineae bacterium]MDW8297795.1 GAF domain-containing protein [Anaerolineae bacterium]